MADVIRPEEPGNFLMRILCATLLGHKWEIIQTPPPQPLIWHCTRCNRRHTT
jgi:hypothetical protein